MQQHDLKHRVVALLAEAEHAPELMDRTDYQHLLLRLANATQELLQAHEQLEQEHQEMASRLNRAPCSSRVPREIAWPQFQVQHQS